MASSKRTSCLWISANIRNCSLSILYIGSRLSWQSLFLKWRSWPVRTSLQPIVDTRVGALSDLAISLSNRRSCPPHGCPRYWPIQWLIYWRPAAPREHARWHGSILSLNLQRYWFFGKHRAPCLLVSLPWVIRYASPTASLPREVAGDLRTSCQASSRRSFFILLWTRCTLSCKLSCFLLLLLCQQRISLITALDGRTTNRIDCLFIRDLHLVLVSD